MIFSRVLFGLSLATLAAADIFHSYDPRIQTKYVLDQGTTGPSTTPDGRVFFVLPHADGSDGPKIVEVFGGKDNNTFKAFPNEEWNSWNASTDSAADAGVKFVRTNSQRVGPDGLLYVVDSGYPDQWLNSSKLVAFNLTTNAVQRIYYTGESTGTEGLLNDVRIYGKYAYITEYSIGSIIIIDLETGKQRLLLKRHRSTVANLPNSGDGKFLVSVTTGKPQYIHADDVEISPDGKYFYYQPGSGYMWRIETQYLNDALYNDTTFENLGNYTEPFSLTPATGGTAIDADGNIYYSDVDRQEIRRLSPNQTTTLVTRDDRLKWVDALWIDNYQNLWLSVSQLNKGVRFVQPDNKSNTIVKPLYVYTINIGVGPSPADHA
ncbi:hypothetical protein N7495_005371 [Penicillium taxi]|uniref:uncharacterized protein n=1 Tax=Penicillium taxi TaxID=168475 RepID=UPI0025451B75|nr:uncharacterized protein N7495_005371 [Penicillium taxi]KAJ5893680.1 hypothetical protein N7495_005371 [Penicillium taxi]